MGRQPTYFLTTRQVPLRKQAAGLLPILNTIYFVYVHLHEQPLSR